MREPMKGPITSDFANICLRVPTVKVDRVKAAVEKFLDLVGVQYTIADEDEELVSWEEVFPDLHPGNALKGARLIEELTQAQLAEKIGVKRHHISEMETGKRSIDKDMAKRLAKTLNTGYKVFF
jgi:DNA-binding XRE family transcriptional regulator